MVEINGYDIELTRGDTLFLRVDLSGRDLPEGTDALFTVKRSIRSDEVLLRKRFDAADEVLGIRLTSRETRLEPGVYVWDVRLQIPHEDGSVEIYTPMEYAAFVVLDTVGETLEENEEGVIVDEQLALKELRAVIAQTNAAAQEAIDAAGEADQAAAGIDEKVVESTAELVKDMNGPLTDEAVLLRKMSVHMDSAEKTILVAYESGSGTANVIFAKKNYYFPKRLTPDATSVLVSYADVLTSSGTLVFVYDTANNVFAARKMGEDSAAFKYDVILFWAYLNSDGEVSASRAFVNAVFIDGKPISLDEQLAGAGERSGLIEKEVAALWSEAANLKSSTEGAQTFIGGGHYEASKSGPVMEYTEIKAGEVYKIIATNRTAPVGNPVVFMYHTDGTSISLKSGYRTEVEGTYIWNITIPEDYVKLRLYCNVNADVPNVAFDWAWYRVGCKRIDLIEKEIAALSAETERIETLENEVAALSAETDTFNAMSFFNRTTSRIFKRVVCCGDSYTSGHISLEGETAATNEDYAWPHYMSLITGNEWINCGCSGCNVLTWQTHERGLPAAQAAGKAQAYVIGLMINDVSDSSRAVELGTAADIGTDAQTYYGGMSAIIRQLNAISPDAKIFVNTCPKTGTKYTAYNQAVRDVVAAYQDTYPVHCIDLEAVKALYTNASLTEDALAGHYTAIGYEQLAEIYSYVLSDYINRHVSAFQNVHQIECGG